MFLGQKMSSQNIEYDWKGGGNIKSSNLKMVNLNSKFKKFQTNKHSSKQPFKQATIQASNINQNYVKAYLF